MKKLSFLFDFSIFLLIADVFLFLIDDVDLLLCLSRIFCKFDDICENIIVSIDWIIDTIDAWLFVFLHLLISSKNALCARDFSISCRSRFLSWLKFSDITIDFELSSIVFIDFDVVLLTMMYCCLYIVNFVDVIESWYLIRSIFFCFFLHFFFMSCVFLRTRNTWFCNLLHIFFFVTCVFAQ